MPEYKYGRSDSDRRAQWEFVFWCARESLDIAARVVRFLCIAVVTVAVTISLIAGEPIGAHELVQYLGK